MQFGTLAFALTTLVGLVACTPNGFISPTSDDTLYAGSSFVVRWNKTDGGATVALKLLDGPSTNLQEVLTISSNLTNNGAVRWKVPDSVSSGTYALEIIDGDDTSLINYTPQFKIVNNVTTTTSSSSSSTSISSSSTISNSSSAASTTAVIVPAAAGINGTNSTTSSSNITTASAKTTSLATSAASASGSASSGSATSSGSKSDASSSAASLANLLLAGGLGAIAFFSV